jgi:hypothetical protein
MDNRFIEMDRHLKRIVRSKPYPGGLPRRHAGRSAPASGAAGTARSELAQPFAVQDRALVVLIENGGVDLGLPTLVERVLSVLPGSELIPDSYRTKMIEAIRRKIESLTDALLESAELYINRFSAAAPDQYGEVAVLRDGTSSYDDLKGKLIALTRAGKVIDLFVLTHGSGDFISVPGGISSQKIREMKAANGRPISLRSVYMMNCVGSSLNQAWLDAGAKVSSGAFRNNYLPEPSMFFFWQNWKDGQSFENAVTGAYRKTINLMNETVRSLIRSIPIPGTGALADLVDFENLECVKDSAPVIQGQRSVTIASDNLSFAQSLPFSSLATTVLPLSLLRTLVVSTAASTGAAPAGVHAYSYQSPSALVTPLSGYSVAMNPGALLIAGIEVADAASIGLAAVGLVQAQVSASQGSFTLSYDKAQRLLTTEARDKMPGSQTTKTSYSRRLFYLGIGALVEAASAEVVIEWEGNPYGEIGTAIIRRKLSTSTEFSKSSANISITKTDRIPLPRTDPRAWPIVFTYEGTYDPYGNGYFEFSGEFEINAFGGLKFNRHEVVSRSFADFAIGGSPEDKVQKGADVVVPVPAIPQEQIDYLRTRLP